MPRVFISYSRSDEPFARQLAASLSQMGADIWIDVEDIPAGLKWSSAIQQGLDTAEALIVIISPESMASRNVEDEWQYFLDHQKPVVPVLLRPAKIHFQLNRIQYIDFHQQPYEAALRQLYVELSRKGLALAPNTPDPALAYRPAPHQMTPSAAARGGGGLGSRGRVLGIGAGVLALVVVVFMVLNNGILTPTVDPTPTVTPPLVLATEPIQPTVTDAPTGVPTDPPTQTPTDAPTETTPPTLAATSTPVQLGLPGNPVFSNTSWSPVRRTFGDRTMVLVPAGCFTIGSTTGDIDFAQSLCSSALGECSRSGYEDEQPAQLVCFEQPFWLDATEVTNGQYGSAGAFPGDDYPRTNVTWNEADAYCAARGMRLPTEAEWEYAARGPDGLVFPWGNDFDGSRLNYCEGDCPYNWKDTNYSDGYGTTAPVGSYPAGASWVGALDMAGNVWEWTSSIYAFPYPYFASDGRENQNDPASKRTLRGGSWNWIAADTRAMSRDDYAENSQTRYESSDWYGFRCVRVFNPLDLAAP
jgi:formylglycine-generating enzyme required for sulfatase activity